MPISDEIVKALTSIDPDTVKYIAEGVGIKTLYEDFASPTVKKAGILGAKIFSALTVSVDAWADQKLKRFQVLQDDIVQNLEDTNPDDIIAPPGYIIIPALNSYMYSMDKKELRKMYANLISRSMIKEYDNKIHPSFVTIIQNLAPEESVILEYIDANNNIPLGETRWKNADGMSFSTHMPNVYAAPHYMTQSGNKNNMRPGDAGFVVIKTYHNVSLGNPIYISNLSRLGLIELSYAKALSKKGAYYQLLNFPEVINDKNDCEKNKQIFEFTKGTIFMTPLGKSFVNICIE